MSLARLSHSLVLLLLVGCAPSGPQLENQKHQLFVFGTLLDINLWQVEPQKGNEAVASLSRDFQRMHNEWHAWKPGPLVDINTAIHNGESVKVIPSLIPIIQQSQLLERKSDHLFNPAIGGLLNLWGFQSDGRPNGPPPPKEAIQRWVSQAPSMDDIHMEGDILTSDNPAVQMDFGGFAKGYAIDLAIERLREMGIENAIVNAGGDLRAIGSKGGEPWVIGVRHPQGGDGILAAIAVSGDESVFTSGNYERYREHEGVHYPHILDPRTGMPVVGITSATVIHDNGAEADAASTALVVAGSDEWYRIAKQMGIQHAMLVDDKGVLYMDPGMQERVQFKNPPDAVVLSAPL